MAGETVSIAARETLHTENSYKYEPAQFEALAASAGFTVQAQYADPQEWFSLYLLKVAS